MPPHGLQHRRDRSLYCSPETNPRVAAAGRWIRSDRGPPQCVQTNPRVPATPGATLGASWVTSGDTRATHDLRRREGPTRVSSHGTGRAGCWWPGLDVFCSGMAMFRPTRSFGISTSFPSADPNRQPQEEGERATPGKYVLRLVSTSVGTM